VNHGVFKAVVMTLRCVVVGCAVMGCATTALEDGQRAHIERLVRKVQAEAFPELQGHDVAIGAFDEESAFFESNFDVLAALMGERRYRIAVNPRLFALDAPEDALAGVVAHELAHTLDYQRRDRWGLMELLPALVFSDANARFERWTDLQAVARGYGPSLLRYREWQRSVLTDAQWRQKLVTYYGPRELALLIDVRGRCPQAFYAMLSKPPRSTREIVTHCP
jgi:hypothetical protein